MRPRKAIKLSSFLKELGFTSPYAITKTGFVRTVVRVLGWGGTDEEFSGQILYTAASWRAVGDIVNNWSKTAFESITKKELSLRGINIL